MHEITVPAQFNWHPYRQNRVMGNEEVCESTNDWSFNVRGGTKNECSIDRKLLKMFGWISIANISQLSKLTPASNSQSQVQLFRISCSPPTNEPDNEWELPFSLCRFHVIIISVSQFKISPRLLLDLSGVD